MKVTFPYFLRCIFDCNGFFFRWMDNPPASFICGAVIASCARVHRAVAVCCPFPCPCAVGVCSIASPIVCASCGLLARPGACTVDCLSTCCWAVCAASIAYKKGIGTSGALLPCLCRSFAGASFLFCCPLPCLSVHAKGYAWGIYWPLIFAE